MHGLQEVPRSIPSSFSQSSGRRRWEGPQPDDTLRELRPASPLTILTQVDYRQLPMWILFIMLFIYIDTLSSFPCGTQDGIQWVPWGLDPQKLGFHGSGSFMCLQNIFWNHGVCTCHYQTCRIYHRYCQPPQSMLMLHQMEARVSFDLTSQKSDPLHRSTNSLPVLQLSSKEVPWRMHHQGLFIYLFGGVCVCQEVGLKSMAY